MSISEFSATLKAQIAKKESSIEAKKLLDRLAQASTAAYKSKHKQLQNASILNEDSEAFRKQGEKQGYTRLVITEDSLKQVINVFNISGINNVISYYINYLVEKHGKYKVKHFEFYTDEGLIKFNKNQTLKSIVEELSSKNIIAVRGLNFSHENTLKHLADFLSYVGVLGTRSEIIKTISYYFERGHIYAQTTGRQQVSIGGIKEEEDLLDKIVKLSILLDESTSSLANPKYSKLLANVKKDFNTNSMRMNIEFQLKTTENKTGNQDSADITRGLRIISSLRNLLDRVTFSKSGALLSSPTGVSLNILAKQLDSLNIKIQKYEEKIILSLASLAINPEEYIADLKSSDSIKDYTTNTILEILSKKPTKSLKINKGTVLKTSSKPVIPLVKVKEQILKEVNNRKKDLATIKKLSLGTRARSIVGSFVSLTSIQNLINQSLHDQIQQNMGKGHARTILNYRTGRFANSAKVTNMRMSRDGSIEAFYTYMKMPYATFEPEGRQGQPVSRDPRKLIEKSMRQIATQLTINRLRAIPT